MNLKKGNYKNIRKHLAKLDWKAILNNKSITLCWDAIKFEIDKVINESIPLRLHMKRSAEKCLYREVFRKIKYEECIWNVYRNNGTDIYYRDLMDP